MKKIFIISSAFAVIILSSFWISTIYSELLGSHQDILLVKQSIVKAFWVFIPVMALIGISANILSKKIDNLIIKGIKKRLPILAINGLIFLLPLAFILRYLAENESFTFWFYTFQIVELVMGVINFSIIVKNLKEGLKLVTS